MLSANPIAIVFCPWVPNTVCFYSLTTSSQVLYWWYLGSAFGWQGHFYLLLANIVKTRLLICGSFITWGVGWDCTMSNGECYLNALCQHKHSAANTVPCSYVLTSRNSNLHKHICMWTRYLKERYAIIKLPCVTPNLAINICNEVHGACRHKPWFHRFDHSENANSSTDESRRMNGSRQPSSTTSMGSSSSNHTLGSLNDCREEPTLGPSDPVPTYWENWSHGLRARSLLT
jgi:hypothetical protein